MDQSFSFVADRSADGDGATDIAGVVATILPVFASGQPERVHVALREACAGGLDLTAIDSRPVLVELITRSLDWLENEALVVPTLDLLASIGPEAALTAFDLLFGALFPEGRVEAEAISDQAVVVLARLLAEVGHLDDALAFFRTATGMRDPSRYMPLVHAARCHMLGLDGSINLLWPALHNPVDGDPYNPQTWRAMARTCAAVADWKGAVAMLSSGMALPVLPRAKIGLGADLAAIAVFARARGQMRMIEGDARIRQALVKAPMVVFEAQFTLTHWPQGDADALYDADLRQATAAWLHDLAP